MLLVEYQGITETMAAKINGAVVMVSWVYCVGDRWSEVEALFGCEGERSLPWYGT